MGAVDDIWAGDKLRRREEAAVLERFLTNEGVALRDMGREQAFVLALDAQYGEGKSWFLTRLRQQLALNHAVAFVDAWVDDANNEPLVSIMAALHDAMEPFLKKQGIKDKFGALTRAAFPIIGKAVLGAGGKFVAKYLGDEFGDAAKQAVSAASVKGGDKSPLEKGIETGFEGLGEVVDHLGAAMLDQYRARQRSRETFKSSLRSLAASIDELTDDPRVAPIYIIVDELDRCRPSYAISVLEEIKHLFDVPGVVFIIALHGSQLTHSINAVYGQGFDSKAYLRRFFSRTYELRRLSILELVVERFNDINMGSNTFSFPPVWQGGKPTDSCDPAVVAGHLLSEWLTTPREALAVVDALRLFVAHWDKPIAIELPLVLIMLLNLVRSVEPVWRLHGWSGKSEVIFSISSGERFGPPGSINSPQLIQAYENATGTSLPDLASKAMGSGIDSYIGYVASQEFGKLHGNSYVGDQKPPSSWIEYAARVKQLGPFVSLVLP